MEPYHAMLPPTSFQEAAAPETDDGESSSLEDDAELRQRLQAAMEDPYMQPEPAPEKTDEEVSIPTDLESAEALEVAADADGGGGDVVPERASSARPVDVRSSSTSRRRIKEHKKKRDKKKKKRARSRSRRSRSARRARSSS